MNNEAKFIFDMDGTLYQFDEGRVNNFTKSRFYSDLKEHVYGYLSNKLGLSNHEARVEYERIKDKYSGEISIGVEKEYEIDRYEFFANTWNFDPSWYLKPNPTLRVELSEFKGRSALLTAAPAVWSTAALDYLKVRDIFSPNIFTGEPDLRKPNPEVFGFVAEALKIAPQLIFSIGDQEYSDILPAQAVGMKTVLIGTPKESKPDYYAANLLEAIAILKREGII